MLWAILRTEPKRAYFEFEAHPAIITPKTLTLAVTRNCKTPKTKTMSTNFIGYNNHNLRERPSIRLGATINGKRLARSGITNSLQNNLPASLKGCINPM